MSKLTEQEKQEIRDALRRELPPSIGLVGVSGVGKSSTINAMFKTSLAISHTVACTKEFEAIDTTLQVTNGEAKGEQVTLRVIDAPGLGEDIFLDPKYIEMYKMHLPPCDVILWILSARNRAMALDQLYLENFLNLNEKMVFAVNQVDLVPPMDWNHKINLPSDKMDMNIADITQDRAEKLKSILKREVQIMPYSATYGYNLEQLFYVLIKAIPERRRWLFDSLKNFSYKDFIPINLR